MTVTIREETPADLQAIAAVTMAAFRQTRHTSGNEQHIIAALRAAGLLTVSLLAAIDGVIVGHVAISPVVISDGAAGWFGLGPLAVLPQHQGKGVGSQLMGEALHALRGRGACGCVVPGEPQFYGRFGFLADPALVLPGVPPAYFQALSFAASRPRGVVSYHAAFSAGS